MSVAIARPQKNIPLLYAGIAGNGIVPFIKVPSANLPIGTKNGRKVQLGRDTVFDKVNVVNTTSSFTTAGMSPSCRVLNINVLRNEKGSAFEGLQPLEGFARHQRRGLGYMPDHPLNARILVNTDSFFSTRRTKLGTPA